MQKPPQRQNRVSMKCKWTKAIYIVLKDLFYYDINQRDIKSTMIARIIVIVFLLQSMAACVESLPVIIMYQSFGSNLSWLLSWMFWWFMPILLSIHLWYICNDYIKSLRTNENNYIQSLKSQKYIIFNGVAEMLLFFIVLIVSIVAESNKTNIAVWFLIVSGFTSLMIAGVLWIFVLHFMFLNIKCKVKDNDKLDLLLNNNDHDEKQLERKESNALSNSYVSLGMDHYQAGYCCCVLYWWLFEKREIQQPARYGERIYLRRLFLWFGTGSYGYISIHYFCKVLNITVKQSVIDFFNDLDAGVTWPDDDEGGTLFNSTFRVYDTARVISASCSLFGFVLFFCSLFADFIFMEKKGLKFSRIFGWLSIIALLFGIFGPSLPNYLSSTPIHEICPYCAPQFNNAIYLLFGDIIGLFCSGLFTLQMLPILVGAVVPAIVRSSYMVLHYYKLYKLDLNEQDTIRYIFICGSLLGPFTTFAPLLVYQQFMGDCTISALLMIFWIVPVLIALNIKTKNCTTVYLCYMATYYGTLLTMFVYHWARYGLPHWLVLMIQNAHWIIETFLGIVAEVCLTNVLLSDFLYTIIMGFRRKHLR